MKNLFFSLTLVLSIGLALSSCRTNKKNGGEKGTETTAGVPEDFMLTIYHQGCRGSCPDYKITVDAAGNATYVGRRSVEMMGEYSKQLENRSVRDLVEAIEEYKFFEFEDEYGTEVADLPEVHTTVKMYDKEKRIRDVRNAPAELKALEARLENIIGTEGWEKD